MYDICIAGGGIVGLATALRLQEARPDLRIVVIEKEDDIARHQTGHNSGVIHSGIYYKPGSLRALNCIKGYRDLLEYCDRHQISYDICGKVIAAVTDEELPQLELISHRGKANGLDGIRPLTPDEAADLEPYLRCKAAIFVPQTGIIQFSEVATQHRANLLLHGNEVITGAAFQYLRSGKGSGFVVGHSKGELETRVFVNTCGLYADKVATQCGINHGLMVLPFRGEYYELKPSSHHLVRNLIYPVPNPAFPFLGVHFTRMMNGSIEAGPNAVLAYAREGYTKKVVNLKEFSEFVSFPGFRKIAAKYWREGLDEQLRSWSKPAFVRTLQRLLPDITADDLTDAPAGVRAMACDASGNLLDDFYIVESPGQVHVLNAPSPAATANLAIGETIAQKVLRQL